MEGSRQGVEGWMEWRGLLLLGSRCLWQAFWNAGREGIKGRDFVNWTRLDFFHELFLGS